jgi:dolichol-phosphate mannosyltransferase
MTKKSLKNKPLISICIPVLNEEKNIKKLYSELCAVSKTREREFKFEFVFTDNNSTDKTWTIIKELSKNDSRIRGFRFPKNIGFQRSIFYGYMQARGKAIIQIDADLQDPPITILEFLSGWKEGYKVVVGIRRGRRENLFIRSFRKLGYIVIARFARFEITKDAGDFRLIDREVVEILRASNNPQPYLRGAVSAIGFPEKKIVYDRQERKQGDSKIGFKTLVKLGFSGLINYSNLLSKLALLVFTISLLLSVIGIFLNLKAKFISNSNDIPPGFTTVVILLFISITINSLFFAIIIHYLQRIHSVVTNEEQVVVIERT